MSLKDQINDILDDHGEIYYAQLDKHVQRALAAQYIRENEDIIYDLFANVHETSFAHHFADILDGEYNLSAIFQDLRSALQIAKDFESLLDGEIDHQVMLRAKFAQHEVERAEYMEER